MTGAVLILAHAGDEGAKSVAARLVRELGADAVRVVRPEGLSLARWSHRVDSTGRASTRIALPRAPAFTNAGVAAVFNRIRYLAVPRFRRRSAKDRDYAGAEFQAIVVSWLAELGDRVVHVVRRHPWVTPSLPLQHWASAAAACGLPVAKRTIVNSPQAQTGADVPGSGMADFAGTVLTAGERAGGPMANRYGLRCLATARALGFPLLEFCFDVEEKETVLVHVDPLPPLAEPWAVAMAGDLLKLRAREWQG